MHTQIHSESPIKIAIWRGKCYKIDKQHPQLAHLLSSYKIRTRLRFISQFISLQFAFIAKFSGWWWCKMVFWGWKLLWQKNCLMAKKLWEIIQFMEYSTNTWRGIVIELSSENILNIYVLGNWIFKNIFWNILVRIYLKKIHSTLINIKSSFSQMSTT